eukprot:COSAG01_NODE_5768_length_4046_cov_1.760578_4_plen_147_part_00
MRFSLMLLAHSSTAPSLSSDLFQGKRSRWALCHADMAPTSNHEYARASAVPQRRDPTAMNTQGCPWTRTRLVDVVEAECQPTNVAAVLTHQLADPASHMHTTASRGERMKRTAGDDYGTTANVTTRNGGILRARTRCTPGGRPARR